MKETINGVIHSIVFRNKEDGFTVFNVNAPPIEGKIKMIGQTEAMPGQNVVATGEWIRMPATQWHAEGRQFKAQTITASLPSTTDGIVKYLSSGIIKGLGEKSAGWIVDRFGLLTITVIENSPHELSNVKGIGAKTLENIKKGWHENKITNEIMIFLHSNGVPAGQAWRIYKVYGKQAIDKIIENPYQLSKDVKGIGFIYADKIALNLGVPKESMQRARAAITYMLNDNSLKGHCGMHLSALITATSEKVEISQGLVEKAVMEELLVEKDPAICLVEEDNEQIIFLSKLAFYEQMIASKIKDMVHRPPPWKKPTPEELEKIIAHAEREAGITLAEEQREAVRIGLTYRVMVLTGGPGTGKTSILNCLLAAYRYLEIRYMLAAPTGKAAKRMNESTGSEAQTLHRLFKIGQKIDHPKELEADVIVMDETSMMDVMLTYSALKGMPKHAAVVFVGDINQLPSVGPGSVLGDIISSEIVPVVRLTKIFRQAQGSLIIKNAHSVNTGFSPEKGSKEGDFFFLPLNENVILSNPDRDHSAEVIPEEYAKLASEMVVDLVSHRLPSKYGYDPRKDIQVLSPINAGISGTANMNMLIQQAINPATDLYAERMGVKYGIGDRVMQITNNYEKVIFNGDTGFIVEINKDEKTLLIDFDGLLISYDFNELDEIRLAYAMTIHKCVHPDTIIESKEGLIKIKDVLQAGFVASADGSVAYDQKIELDEMDAFEIITERGYRLVATDEHGMDVWDGEKYARCEAKNMIIGDWLRLKNEVVVEPDSLPHLPEKPSADIRAKDFNVPSVMSVELAEFLGLFVADGTLYKAGFRLSKRHEDVAVRFSELILTLFNINIDVKKISNAFYVEVNSTLISSWLALIGGLDPNKKEVPDCIMRSSSVMHAAFLKGLFEDGSVHIENREGNSTGVVKHIELVIKKQDLAEKIQLLLLRFGVVSKLTIRKYGIYLCYALRITGESIDVFKNKIGFIAAVKNEKLAMRKPGLSRVVMPISRSSASKLASLYKGSESLRCRYQNPMTYGTISRSMAEVVLKEMELPELTDNLAWHHERIQSITKTKCKAICLHVPNTHRFLQNGFSGWNSQGSQFPVVVLMMLNQHYMMLARNLLYTGITRATKLVVLVGQETAIDRAVKNDKTTQRITQLKKLLIKN